MFGSFPPDLLSEFKEAYEERRQAMAIGYPQQSYSDSEDALGKFRDAMLNSGQQTNMPSRGQPSTFVEEEKKLKWKRDEQTGKLEVTDGKPEEPKAPPKGKKEMDIPKGATKRGVSQSTQQAQVKGSALAHNKQNTQAGRQAQMKNLQKIHTQRVNPG